jgi:hypothetical protein
VAPKGEALLDPDYVPYDPTTPLGGYDEITYEVALPKEARDSATGVRARLISQSIPPYFLSQIFAQLAVAKRDPTLVETERQLIVDGSFLHYVASRFDTSALDRDGTPYLQDWKLEVGADERPLWPHIPHGPLSQATDTKTLAAER